MLYTATSRPSPYTYRDSKALIKKGILLARKTCIGLFRVIAPFWAKVPYYVKLSFFLGQVVEHLYGRQVSDIGA